MSKDNISAIEVKSLNGDSEFEGFVWLNKVDEFICNISKSIKDNESIILNATIDFDDNSNIASLVNFDFMINKKTKSISDLLIQAGE